MEGGPVVNTDRELWRETEGDYYAPSVHVTEHGMIGINVGGLVFVKPVREWHRLATEGLRDIGLVPVSQSYLDAFKELASQPPEPREGL